MEVKLSSSGKKIIASGSFVTFDKEISTISLRKGKEGICLNLTFENKPSANQNMNFSSEKNASKNEVVVNMTFTNFNNALPTSLTFPLSIARWDTGEEVYFQICVKSISEKVKEVTYTIYEGEKK